MSGGVGEADLTIPDFLLVKNRAATWPGADPDLPAAVAAPERKDWRKPKGTTWEEWDASQEKRRAQDRARTEARIAALREREAAEPRLPRTPGYKGHLAGSRKARVHECYDAEGAGAAAELGGSLGLKDGTVRSWIKGWSKEGPA